MVLFVALARLPNAEESPMARSIATREWYTFETAAEYLGASERQIRRWSQQGKVERYRLGNRTLFTREALDDFIERSRRPATV